MITIPAWLFGLLALGTLGSLHLLLLRPLLRRRRERIRTRAHDEARERLPVGPPAFSLLPTGSAADLVLIEASVQDAISREAEESGRERGAVLREARDYAREIVPSLHARLHFRFRRSTWRFLTKLFRIHLIHEDEAGLAAAGRDRTLVFVLNHRSNLDYLIAAAWLSDRAILSFAVGEWAKYWPLRPLLRAMGGFFVRRGSGNRLYRAVLAGYVAVATRSGVPQAFFIEGRFSFDGALGEPRLGLLDYVVRSLGSGNGAEPRRDVALVPAAVNYDRVLEDRSLQVIKAAGRAPTRLRAIRATFGLLLQQSWLLLNRRWKPFGFATLRIGAPISLADWIRGSGLDLPNAGREERFAHVARLGGLLMDRIAGLMPVLPVPLVALVLSDGPPGGLTDDEVQDAAFALLIDLHERAGLRHMPPTTWLRAVDLGTRLLLQRRMARRVGDRLEVSPERRGFVEYYANSIRHFVPKPTGPAPAAESGD